MRIFLSLWMIDFPQSRKQFLADPADFRRFISRKATKALRRFLKLPHIYNNYVRDRSIFLSIVSSSIAEGSSTEI
jgi:hypothetical protein